MSLIIGIDFDGTIVDHMYPFIGRAAPGVFNWVHKWILCDVKIILFTMRGGNELDQAVDFLTRNHVPLFGVNKNPTQHEWTDSPKVYANLYIDDASFGCPLIMPEGFSRPCVDWSIVGPEVYKRLGR